MTSELNAVDWYAKTITNKKLRASVKELKILKSTQEGTEQKQPIIKVFIKTLKMKLQEATMYNYNEQHCATFSKGTTYM